MSEALKLFTGWASPFGRRVELALKIKGVPYKYIEEDLIIKSPEILKYNPVHKKIPVLVHNGKPIAESLVILEYIDDTWKHNPLLPTDHYDRSQARFWAKFADEKILQTLWNCFMCINIDERDKAIEGLCQQLEFLEKELKGKEFLGGEKIGYTDIVGFASGYWITVIQEIMEKEVISEEKFPAITKWVKKLLNIDVFKECIPPKERHIPHVIARREYRRKTDPTRIVYL